MNAINDAGMPVIISTAARESHPIKAGMWLAEGRTVSEVARRLAVDRKTLQRYINRGLIPGMNPASRSSSDDRDHEVDDPAASTTDQVPSGKNDDAREEAQPSLKRKRCSGPLFSLPIRSTRFARNDDTPPDAAVPADAVCSLDHHRAEPDQNDTREIERPSPDAAGPARPAAGLDEEPLDQADPAANDVAAPGVNEPLATGPGSGNTVPALRCSVPWPGQDRAERNRASGQTPMGMATSNGDGRVAASLGLRRQRRFRLQVSGLGTEWRCPVCSALLDQDRCHRDSAAEPPAVERLLQPPVHNFDPVLHHARPTAQCRGAAISAARRMGPPDRS